jgi:hypothetical protein
MSGAPRPPSVLGCLATLAVVDVTARLFGLRRALRLATGPARTGQSAASDVVDVVAHRVAVAGAFYPRRALCLEQSLALCLLLRRRGVPAQLRIGVQPRPFHAHAWVEVAGRPLQEPPDVGASFATFQLTRG